MATSDSETYCPSSRAVYLSGGQPLIWQGQGAALQPYYSRSTMHRESRGNLGCQAHCSITRGSVLAFLNIDLLVCKMRSPVPAPTGVFASMQWD